MVKKCLTLLPLDGPNGPMTNTGKEEFQGVSTKYCKCSDGTPEKRRITWVLTVN